MALTKPPTKPTLSIVIPVYQGEHCLPDIVAEISSLRTHTRADPESPFVISELVLVHDCGPDRSDETLLRLEAEHAWVHVVWLARNFGQHPATIAGIADTTSEWIVTMDEDGLHDPATIVDLVDRALASGADLVYGQPQEPRPHPWYRNATSSIANFVFRKLSGTADSHGFASFRLIDGPIGREVASFCGQGVYLDVALGWAISVLADEKVPYRTETRHEDQTSGYSMMALLGHFRRLVVTSGTRPLRIVAVMGLASTIVGLMTAVLVIILRLAGNEAVVEAQGWTSVIIAVVFFSGLIMLALGVVAEYLSLSVTMATGRPSYIAVGRPPRKARHRAGSDRKRAE